MKINEIDNDNPIRFNKPIGYILKIVRLNKMEFFKRKKRIWR